MTIKRKKYNYLALAIFAIFILSSCINLNNKENNLKIDEGKSQINTDEKSTDYSDLDFNKDMTVSRALAAKMIALTYNDIGDIKTMDREIKYKDVEAGDWYDIYINAVTVQGFMNGKGDMFEPLEPLTYSDAQTLLDRIADGKYNIKMNLSKEDGKKCISYKDWLNIYIKLITKLAGEKSIEEAYGIKERDLVVVATPANSTEVRAWEMGTDKGIYGFSGLSMDSSIDKKIKVLLKDNEVFAFLGEEEETTSITNVYITETSDNELSIFVGGVNRTYKSNRDFSMAKGKIADIQIQAGTILNLETFEEEIRGRVLRSDSTMIEIERLGNIPLSKDYKLYNISGDKPVWSSLSNLIIGEDIARFIIKDKKICACIIDKKTKPQKMRVALHKTGFEGLIHSDVSLTSDDSYKVYIGEEEIAYKAGETFNIKSLENKLNNSTPRVRVVTNSPDKKIKILSIQRNGDNPKYRGSIEIIKLSKGGYSIVNEVPIEEYLYSVIPSEMPSSYGLEAAKVQAVTARSYAYGQFYSNRFHSYGGNVDDSVSCQVYNNIAENDISIQAVKATQNEGLFYEGNVVSANFFSTSCGYTANSGEVWADYADKSFPSYTPPYMTAKKQFEGKDFGDLREEENIKKFLKTKDIEAYDKDFGWFRWDLTMSLEELSASINANLKTRYEANPKLIKTLDENKIFRSRPVESIGQLKKIDILKRGEGGNIMEMVLVGTDATIKILTEYNIRFLLQPKQHIKGKDNIIINLHNGNKMSNYSIMPSAFFVIEPIENKDGKLTGYTFYGGGNGHGAGMSQNGVKGMVDKGYNYKEILKHYYPGTEVKKIY